MTMAFTPAARRPGWQQAAQAKAALAHDLDVIRNDADLSPAGHRRQAAIRLKQTRDQLAAIDAADKATQRSRMTELERVLFRQGDRSSAGALNARDASTRAAAATTLDELRAQAELAALHDDDVWAAAIAHRAVRLGAERPDRAADMWDQVVWPWARATDGAADALDELGRTEMDLDGTSAMERMSRQVHYRAPEVPELAGFNVDQLAALGDEDDLRERSLGETQVDRFKANLRGVTLEED